METGERGFSLTGVVENDTAMICPRLLEEGPNNGVSVFLELPKMLLENCFNDFLTPMQKSSVSLQT